MHTVHSVCKGARHSLQNVCLLFQSIISPHMHAGASTYTRWGRSDCRHGTELVYEGIAAGTRYSSSGGGANLLCLPRNPVYSSYRSGIQNAARLGPVEFHPSTQTGTVTSDDNARCAVCRTTRSTSIMIPATTNCPSGWTREYYGYLMAEHSNNHRGSFVCIDKFAQPFPGGRGHTPVAHDLFHVEAYCNIIPCPPYDDQKELTCAVCSK